MNPAAKAASQLAEQMRLDGPKKGRGHELDFGSTEARVQHENSTPETRAAAATAKFAKADAEIAARKKRDDARTFAHEAFIHGQALPAAVQSAARCVKVDELPLRALIRTIWDAGFSAGYAAGQKSTEQ